MPALNRHLVPVLAGVGALAVLGLWGLASRPPVSASVVLLIVGVGLVAWGLVGKAARRERQARLDLRDSVELLLGELESAGPTRGADEPASIGALLDGIRAARARAPGLLSADADRKAMRDVIEAVGEPVVAIDPGGQARIVNRAAQRMLGVRLEGRPKTIEDLFAQNDVLALFESASRGRPASARVRLAVRDGARVFDTTASPLPPPRGDEAATPAGEGALSAAGGGRWGVVLTFRDVTELTTAIQARTDFVANASHELRTPLAAMKAAYDTLRTAIDDPKMRERAMSLSESNLQRLEEMTRDLLDLSRMESPDSQVRIARVDVRDLAEDVAAQFEAVRGTRGLSIAVEVGDDARRADTDPRLVQEILRNLVDNACRFAHEGTTVRVVGEAIADDPHAPERATLRLSVIDQGIGIPLDQQSRVFERFYQVDPARSGKRRGTGLGLAIVKHAVRALGGSVRVESVWGQGTTMIVDLPSAVAVSRGGGGGEGQGGGATSLGPIVEAGRATPISRSGGATRASPPD